MQAPPSDHFAADGINGPLNPFVVTPPPPDGKDEGIPGYVSLSRTWQYTFIPTDPRSQNGLTGEKVWGIRKYYVALKGVAAIKWWGTH